MNLEEMYRCLGKYVFISVMAGLTGGLASCVKVDETYDLDKEIDKTITVGGNLTLPVSNTEEMKLKDLLEMDDESPVKAGTNGDYSFFLTGETTETEINIDKVRLDTEFGFEKFYCTKDIPFPGNFNLNVEEKIVINIESNEVTSEIKRLAEVETTAPGMYFVFSKSSESTLTLQKGFVIRFPEYITVEALNNSWISNGNELILDAYDGMEITGESRVEFQIVKVDFTKDGAEFTDNFPEVDSNSIRLGGDIQLNGIIAVSSQSPETASISVEIVSSEIVIESVSGTVRPKENNSYVEITSLPEFLSDNEVVLDVTDPRVYVTLSNPTEANISVNASIIPTKDDIEGEIINIEEINVPADQENYIICIHKNPDYNVEGNDEVVIPELGNLIMKIPDVINLIVNDVSAENGNVPLGETIQIKTVYEVNTPLMFSGGTHIKYTETMDGWSTDLDNAEFESIELTMTAVNKVPLGIKLTAEAIDGNGNKLQNVNVDVDMDIDPGSPENPKYQDIKMTVTTEAGSIKGLDGIRMTMTGSASEETKDVVLNENQSIQMTNMRLKLIGGVTIDLN